MKKGLEGIKVVEVGGAFAMPLVGMLMGSWGAEVIHVEPPGRGDNQRHLLAGGMAGWARPCPINYLWEHVGRNKKSITVNLRSKEGQAIIHRLAAEADVFLNNLRPYEIEKFDLNYEKLKQKNPRLIYANLTGFGQRGPEKNAGGYDSVAFWARSGVMELMHDLDSAPNISRPAYGDSVTALSLLAGVMGALFIREYTGQAQQVEVSLFNTAAWVLGSDITGCLITGEEPVRPQRSTMGNPIRNVYPTRDKRWIMLGMTNSQHYWPEFCKAIQRPGLEHDPRFSTEKARNQNTEALVQIIESLFLSKTYAEWNEILQQFRLVWSPVKTPLEVIRDPQALANDFFVDCEHSEYGKIKLLNNPIKLSESDSENRLKAPELGEHTDRILTDLGYTEDEIRKMRREGIV